MTTMIDFEYEGKAYQGWSPEDAIASGVPQAVVDEGLSAARVETARQRCRIHIVTSYPEWQQINILRVGTPEQKERMGQFIDACRAWSNDANPDPAALATIQP